MKQNKETLKEYFETGDKPTQEQYSDLIDSYIDSKQEAGEANRRFVIDETGDVSVTSELEIPEYTLSEITDNKLSLLKDNQIISEVNLNHSTANNIIKQKEITLNIDDLNDTDTYEILTPTGIGTLPFLHKAIYNIDIITAYNEFPSDVLFNLELASGLELHRSPFITTNTLTKEMSIHTPSSSISFTSDDFNKSIFLKPNFNATDGELAIKITLFYSVIEA